MNRLSTSPASEPSPSSSNLDDSFPSSISDSLSDFDSIASIGDSDSSPTPSEITDLRASAGLAQLGSFRQPPSRNRDDLPSVTTHQARSFTDFPEFESPGNADMDHSMDDHNSGLEGDRAHHRHIRRSRRPQTNPRAARQPSISSSRLAEAGGAFANRNVSPSATRSRPNRTARGLQTRQTRGEPDVLVDLELYVGGHRESELRSRESGSANVIDLTNEPDSPDSPVHSYAPRVRYHIGRNVRRSNSQSRIPPPLARSDSSFLDGSAPVIDLTQDSPELPRSGNLPRNQHADRASPDLMLLGVLQGPQLALQRARNARDARQGTFGRAAAAAAGGSIGQRFFRSLPFLGVGLFNPVQPYPHAQYNNPHQHLEEEDDIQFFGMPQNRSNNPVGDIQLQYQNGAFDPRVQQPKPAHEPPQAQQGFTRDTGTDVVVVCPACNEELAYDPEETAGGSHSGKTPKAKRHRSEHHFWALKACGHVYCENCFENRKPTAKKPSIGFRVDSDENHRNHSLCAVDGCTSQVANKTAWVGIYL